jgi:hypothetical protein
MKLFRKHLEIFNENILSFKDKRKKVARAVFSYIGEDGKKNIVKNIVNHLKHFHVHTKVCFGNVLRQKR